MKTKLAAATSGSSPGTACAALHNSAVDGWIDRLSTAPDNLVAPIDTFLVRVQLAIDKCQDNILASTDLPDIVTSADAVTSALAAPAGPSPSAGPSPAAGASAGTAGYLVKTSPCALALAAATPAPDAPPFGYSIDQLVNNALGSGDAPDGYRSADQAIRAMKPCNGAQGIYQNDALDYLGWLAAAAACRTAFYDPATTIYDVGLWLDCITPVNAGAQQALAAEMRAYTAAQSAPCTPGYNPPTIPMSAGMMNASATGIASTAKDAFEAVHNAKEFFEVGKHGINMLIKRRVNAAAVGAYAVKVKAAVQDPITGKVIETTRDRLRRLSLPEITGIPLSGPAKISISVTESSPGVQPQTVNSAVTFRDR